MVFVWSLVALVYPFVVLRLSICLFARSICLSTRSICLSRRSTLLAIRLSTTSTRSATCWSFYNWSEFSVKNSNHLSLFQKRVFVFLDPLPWPPAPIFCLLVLRFTIMVLQCKFVIVKLIPSASFKYFFKIALGTRLCYNYSLHFICTYFLRIMWEISKFQLFEISLLEIFSIFLVG